MTSPTLSLRCVTKVLLAALFGATGVSRVASAGFVQPDFSPSNFTPGAPIDNTYFPLVPGTTFHYAAQVTDPDTGEKGPETEDDAVTGQSVNIAGVPARVVSVRTFLNQRLIEDTRDYYAQDKAGNVWYLGEDTKAFEYDAQGNLTGTDTSGTWHTGVHGAKPGFIMPANPQVIGFQYIQENAPKDGAIDRAENLSVTESVTVPAGHFDNVFKTLETSPLEPGVKENKLYALGVGNILILEDLQPNGQPLNTIPLVSVTRGTAVPLPPAAWAGLFTSAVFVLPHMLARWVRRRHGAAS